jgi:hypothetical protein
MAPSSIFPLRPLAKVPRQERQKLNHPFRPIRWDGIIIHYYCTISVPMKMKCSLLTLWIDVVFFAE